FAAREFVDHRSRGPVGGGPEPDSPAAHLGSSEPLWHSPRIRLGRSRVSAGGREGPSGDRGRGGSPRFRASPRRGLPLVSPRESRSGRRAEGEGTPNFEPARLAAIGSGGGAGRRAGRA